MAAPRFSHGDAADRARLLPLAVLILCCLAADAPARESSRTSFDWGARLRIRQEYLANVLDLSEAGADDSNYLRVRPQLWASWTPNDRWKLHAMITNEHRHWFKSNRGYEDADFEIHELIFENLYIEGRRLGGTPLGFVLGRQNLFYGDGFTCWDGGPLDGSRTAYFNALVLRAEFRKRRLEAHIISNPERDEYLPVVNDQKQSLIEWDETGGGLYYTDRSFAERTIEAYYFYKNERDDDGGRPESNIHTIGARASGAATGEVSFAVEGALQFGDRGSQNRSGYAGSAAGKYDGALAPLAVHAGGFVLSGDDPRTGDTDEGWNPVYARWPKWSELFIYSLSRETGPAFWTNLASAWLGLQLELDRRLTLDGRLYFMWALEPPLDCEPCPPCNVPCAGAESYRRGTLSTLKLAWSVNESLSGHLLWEELLPGGYYSARGSDTAHFLRWEIVLKY